MKTKAKTKAEAKPEAKPEKASKLDVREVVKGVTAITLKKGEVKITEGQAVYKTALAYCIFDIKANRRVAWIKATRVKDVIKKKAA